MRAPIQIAAVFQIAAFCFAASAAWGQSTSAIIVGTVRDADSGETIEKQVSIALRNVATGEAIDVVTVSLGRFLILGAPPGLYWARFEAQGYQTKDIARFPVPVALRLNVSIALRKQSALLRNPSAGYRVAPAGDSDVVASGMLPGVPNLTQAFGFDYRTTPPVAVLNTLGQIEAPQPALSYVVDATWLASLPLSGRDVYTTIVALPGVNSDGATARGLGMSVNGQRPSASNFLLDGVENNSALLSGPLAVMPPESVAEYRVSTAGYSAEFGRTSGAIANAITPSGGNRLHGSVYGYGNSDRLNGNSFERNAGYDPNAPGLVKPLPRAARHEAFLGGAASGAVRRNVAFWSASLQRVGSNVQQDPIEFQTLSVSKAGAILAPAVASMMAEFRPLGSLDRAATDQARDLTEFRNYTPSFRSQPLNAIARFDQSVSGKDRLFQRVAVSRTEQPNFIASTFANLDTAFRDGSTAVALGWFRRERSAVNELRASWQIENLGWNGPDPVLPDISVGDPAGLSVPGGPGSAFAYRARVAEISDTFRWARGRHAFSLGDGALLRFSVAHPVTEPTGSYFFQTIGDFAAGHADNYQLPRYRSWIPDSGVPDTRVPLSNRQYFGFVQDEFRTSARLTLSIGIRWELFGTERMSATWNSFLSGTSGASPEQQLQNATAFKAARQSRDLFAPARYNFAPRIGLGYRLMANTFARASFGLFYDRPYDNLFETQTNDSFRLDRYVTPQFWPVATPDQRIEGRVKLPSIEPLPVWIDGGMKVPRVAAWSVGIERSIGSSFSIAVQHSASLANALITADVVNRPGVTVANPLNAGLPEVWLLSNLASSSYYALAGLAHYRSRRQQFQLAYTWGHSLDNQSDPLQGIYEDLQFIRTPGGGSSTLASFERQFDAEHDRGSSNFDQRHNAVLMYTVELPGTPPGTRGALWTNGWRLSALAAVRSGLPYTVPNSSLTACPGSGAQSTYLLLQQRPDRVAGIPVELSPAPVIGGWKVVNPGAFCSPGSNVAGTLGRNSFAGPGSRNVDLSVAKTIRISDQVSLAARADFFNALNHPNLGNPRFDSLQEFGVERYDRLGAPGQFPAQAPLAQGPRSIFLGVRLLF